MVCRTLAKRYENLTLIPNQQTIFSTKSFPKHIYDSEAAVDSDVFLSCAQG